MPSARPHSAPQLCRRAFQLAGLLLSILILEQNLEAIARSLRIHPTAGTLVGSTGELKPRDRGSFLVARIEPSSPLARAGAGVGDLVVMDDALVGVPSLSTQIPVGLTVRRGDESRHLLAVPAPLGGDRSVIRTLLSVAYIVCDLLAAFLLVTGGRRTAAIELGIALAAFAAPASYVHPLLAGQGLVHWPAGLTLAATNVIAGIAFLAFAVRIDTCANERRNRLSFALAAIVASVVTAVSVMDRTSLSTLVPISGIGWQTRLLTADMLPLFVTLVILIDASRRAAPDMWRRHATLIVGIGVIVFSQLVTDVGMAIGSDATFSSGLALQGVASVAGAGLMTYGVFGQRVIDVGFVINRTLVYGLISLSLLVCFGLLEWAVNFFAPVHGRGRTAALAACLALLVSLAFHRVRIVAENAVERVFFRRWRDREDELHAFLRKAPFFTQPDALSEAALKAFRRFADGTPAAIYQRCAGGDFRRLAGCIGGLEDHLQADTDFLVRLRADGEPVQAASASLVLPMTTRNELNGIVVLGCRPDGSAWRPDQIDELMTAARDVGQDLQVLEIDRLQAEVRQLSQQLASSSRPILSALSRLRG